MTKIAWDKTGERTFESGVSQGVLFIPDESGAYTAGYGWNGLTKVTEKPTGATPTPMYADNRKYSNRLSIEMWAGTIEAYTYPVQFEPCDGSNVVQPGVLVGQQKRQTFGFCYRTELGNDTLDTSLGFKLHLVYECLAAPSERDNESINDTPSQIAFSWEISTTAVELPGYDDMSTITIDSTTADPTALAALEAFLYGTDGADPSMPDPATVLTLFADTITTITPTAPTITSDVITIPTVTGATYYIDSLVVTGTVTITANKVVTVRPNAGYKFPDEFAPEWTFIHT